MAWVRLDDRFPQHPKVIGLSHEAFRLCVSAFCYSSLYQTDGKLLHVCLDNVIANCVHGVEDHQQVLEIIKELVSAGLWEEHPGYYFIHDFFDYNISKSERLKLSEMRRKSGLKGGKANAKQLASRLLEHRSSKTEANDRSSPSPSPSGLSTTPLPPPTGASASTKKSKSKNKLDDPPGFSDFWMIYPRHIARQPAVKAWRSLDPSPELQATILKALRMQLPIFGQRDPEKIPHGATWLNAKRWQDELGGRPGNGHGSAAEDGQVTWNCKVCGEQHTGTRIEMGSTVNPNCPYQRLLDEGVDHGQSPEA